MIQKEKQKTLDAFVMDIVFPNEKERKKDRRWVMVVVVVGFNE